MLGGGLSGTRSGVTSVLFGKSENHSAGIGSVGGLADLVRFLAPGAPDLKKRRSQDQDFAAPRALYLGLLPARLHRMCPPRI
jgi:hypothetical protein